MPGLQLREHLADALGDRVVADVVDALVVATARVEILISGGPGCGKAENVTVPTSAFVVALLVVRKVPVSGAVNVTAVVFVLVPSVSTSVAVVAVVFDQV